MLTLAVAAHPPEWSGSQDWQTAFDALLRRTQSLIPTADFSAARCNKCFAQSEAAMPGRLRHETCRRSDTHAALLPELRRRNRRDFEVAIEPDWRRYSSVATP